MLSTATTGNSGHPALRPFNAEVPASTLKPRHVSPVESDNNSMGDTSLHKSMGVVSQWVLYVCTCQWVLHFCTRQWVLNLYSSQWVLHSQTSQWVLHPCTSQWVLHPHTKEQELNHCACESSEQTNRFYEVLSTESVTCHVQRCRCALAVTHFL